MTSKYEGDRHHQRGRKEKEGEGGVPAPSPTEIQTVKPPIYGRSDLPALLNMR
jgi:hypothetical protein